MHRLMSIAFASALLLAAAAEATPTRRDDPERAADARDKILCKRFVRTGSLADSYRTCKTKWEWEHERENVRQQNWSNPCRTDSRTCGGM